MTAMSTPLTPAAINSLTCPSTISASPSFPFDSSEGVSNSYKPHPAVSIKRRGALVTGVTAMEGRSL